MIKAYSSQDCGRIRILSIDDKIDVQSAFSWAPNVTRKRESKHWYACGADGRSLGRSRDYQIFWDGLIYLPMVLRRRASRAELRYKHQ